MKELLNKLLECDFYKYETTPAQATVELALSTGNLFAGMDWQNGRLFRIHANSFHAGIFVEQNWHDRILMMSKIDIIHVNTSDEDDYSLIEVKVKDKDGNCFESKGSIPKIYTTDFYSYVYQVFGTINDALRKGGSSLKFYLIFSGKNESFAVFMTDEMHQQMLANADEVEKFELPEKVEMIIEWE